MLQPGIGDTVRLIDHQAFKQQKFNPLNTLQIDLVRQMKASEDREFSETKGISEGNLSKLLNGYAISFRAARCFCRYILEEEWSDDTWDKWLERAPSGRNALGQESAIETSTDKPWKSRIRYNRYNQRFEQDPIAIRVQDFVGREFAFKFIDEAKNNQDSGYITVLGNPGDGKSAIAANYLERNTDETIFFFNVRNRKRNSTADYLESLCGQLNERYSLGLPINNPALWRNDAFFKNVLEQVEARLVRTGQKLVVVVDALDEADDATSSREISAKPLLYLPEELPQNMFFLLTARRTFEVKHLNLDNRPVVKLRDNS